MSEMANPKSKYADLPGIALDEPDVYESNDLPESEQTDNFYEPENEPVEKIHISSEEAYNKFKGKFLISSNVDFSEKIGKRVRTGYEGRSGEWELAGLGEKETAIQKYRRLQCEMNELLEEVNDLNKGKEGDALNCLVPTEQVEQSLKLLADLKLEESLGEELIAKISDPEGAQIKKLLAQLEQFKLQINENPESQKGSEDGIVYQFNYKPEHVKFKETARIAELEGRLHRLESVLGSSSDKVARLTAATNKGSLLEAAQYLSATASLLDSSQLDHIEGRLSALSQKLDAIAQKKKDLQQDEEKDKMILELYELVKNSEDISKLLPQTIERLKSLEALHNKATEFTKTLTQIELLQSEISSSVLNNKTLLQGVQESFAINLNEINQTVMSLDSRIKALKNK
ncbi:dynactin subunit 2 [Anthonomus grandis grandis]|uniref:dynactin subunit 2 n=1 Tax=Anthonomus grandis grandis TaxID=2921223 RepID=UPI0021666986|nr:dynactin subunit 2 [Anthonomus grandis grandis]